MTSRKHVGILVALLSGSLSAAACGGTAEEQSERSASRATLNCIVDVQVSDNARPYAALAKWAGATHETTLVCPLFDRAEMKTRVLSTSRLCQQPSSGAIRVLSAREIQREQMRRELGCSALFSPLSTPPAGSTSSFIWRFGPGARATVGSSNTDDMYVEVISTLAISGLPIVKINNVNDEVCIEVPEGTGDPLLLATEAGLASSLRIQQISSTRKCDDVATSSLN